MSTLQEQFSAARQSQIEAQINYFHHFTSQAVESAQQVLHLNIETVRSSLEKSTKVAAQLLQVKDPRDLLALTAQSQNSFNTLFAYSQRLLDIASGAPKALVQQPATPLLQAEAPVQEDLLPAENAVAAPEPAPVEPPLPVEAKPIAKAARKVAPKATADKPAAAPLLAADDAQVSVSGLKPVDAVAPPARPSAKPAAETKAARRK